MLTLSRDLAKKPLPGMMYREEVAYRDLAKRSVLESLGRDPVSWISGGDFVWRSLRDLFQRACTEFFLYSDRAKRFPTDLLQRSCDEASFRELLQRSWQETSWRDLAETLNRDLLHRSYQEGSCRDLAKRSLPESLNRDLI